MIEYDKIYSIHLVSGKLLLSKVVGYLLDGAYVLINPLEISFNETSEGSMIFGKRYLPTMLSDWDSKSILYKEQIASVSFASKNYIEYYERLIEASRYPEEIEHIDIFEEEVETETEINEKQEKTYH